MSVLSILHFPDSRLRTVAKPVSVFDDALRQLVDDMLETMYAAPGIGLAATQVNRHIRLLVMDVSEQGDSPCCLINPQIMLASGKEAMEEGCLSVPDFYETVERAQSIQVQAQDAYGKTNEFEATGIQAACIQHEMDHLQGKLFVDYLSALKRSRIRSKLLKRQKQAV